MSQYATVRLAKAIMDTKRYLSNKEMSELYYQIFGEVPTSKRIRNIKECFFRGKVYTVRHRLINCEKCIRIMDIAESHLRGVKGDVAGLQKHLYEHGKTMSDAKLAEKFQVSTSTVWRVSKSIFKVEHYQPDATQKLINSVLRG